MNTRLFWCVLAACLLTAQQTPVIKVTTRQVQVSVVVHDRKGQPVDDLKKEDFVLYDKGQEQTISYFRVEKLQAPSAPPIKLPAGVYSNRVLSADSTSAARTNAVTIVLLDGTNTQWQDQHAAKEALLKFLGQLKQGDQVAIYTLTDSLHVLHDFTTDIASVLAALARHKIGSPASMDASSYEDANTGDDAMDAFLDQSNDVIANFYQANRTRTTLQAFQTIAYHVSEMPGRKNLIWLSGSFPLFVGQNPDGSLSHDFQSFTDEMQRTVQALANNNIAVYPVDARGLMGTFDTSPSMAPSARGQVRSNRPGIPPVDQRAQKQIFDTQSSMKEVAERTGGRAFMNTNDLTGAIRQAVEDTQVSYIISYAPTHNEWDGRFREIKVKVNRPGAEARCRKGYYATAEDVQDQKARSTAMTSAMESGLVATGLGLMGRIMQGPTEATPRTVVRVIVDPHDVSFTQDETGNRTATLDLLLAVRDGGGAVLHTMGRTLHLKMNPTQFEGYMKTGLPLDADVESPLKATRARVVVRDVASGVTGSLDLLYTKP